jgi:hypothetical protein
MIIIGNRRKPIPIASFPRDCPQCGKETVHLYGEVRENLTLYYIPTPMGSRWPYVQCSECGLSTRISEEKEQEIRSLSRYGGAPFRICPKCGTNNDLDTTFCVTCDRPLKPYFLPKSIIGRIFYLIVWAFVGLVVITLLCAIYLFFTGRLYWAATIRDQNDADLDPRQRFSDSVWPKRTGCVRSRSPHHPSPARPTGVAWTSLCLVGG